LVQNRVAIDRFTGGAYETALFSEQPIFGGPDSRLTIRLRIINPKDYEIGLLLLLLKDLWTGDLALGGESSVGRGRLQGIEATLTRRDTDAEQSWRIEQAGEQLALPEKVDTLEDFVKALSKYTNGEGENQPTVGGQ
jgi:CRISPR/Cas system CSM-associated protein Csm3 (group 7 of RAMP superfamily)